MQTSVSTTQKPGVAGQLGDCSNGKRAESVTSEEASAEIRAGIMVAQGTLPTQCKLLAAQEDFLKGIVLLDHTAHKDIEVGDTGFKPKTEMSVLTQGVVWVLVEGTLPDQNDPVHVRAELTAAEPLGLFLKAPVSGKTVNLSDFARWTGRTGTGIAELEFNLVNQNLRTSDA